MDYFDSKVLESFLIPEYDIATENFLSNIGSKILALFQLIYKAIGRFINFVKSKFGRKKSNVSSNNKDNDNKEKTPPNLTKNVEIPNALVEYVRNEDFVQIRPFIVNAIIGYDDPKIIDVFTKYVDSKINGLWQDHDGEEFPTDQTKWTADLLNRQIIKSFNNFSHERIAFIKKIYPYAINNIKKESDKKKNVIPLLEDASVYINDISTYLGNLILGLQSYKGLMASEYKYISLIEEKFNKLKDLDNTLQKNIDQYIVNNNDSHKYNSIIENLEKSKDNIEHNTELYKKTLNSAKTKYGGSDKDHENDQYYKDTVAGYNKIIKYTGETSKIIMNLINNANKLKII